MIRCVGRSTVFAGLENPVESLILLSNLIVRQLDSTNPQQKSQQLLRICGGFVEDLLRHNPFIINLLYV